MKKGGFSGWKGCQAYKENFPPMMGAVSGSQNSGLSFSKGGPSLHMRPSFDKSFSMFEAKPKSHVLREIQAPAVQKFEFQDFGPAYLFKPPPPQEPKRKSTRSQKSQHRASLFRHEEDENSDAEDIRRHLFEDVDSRLSTEATSQHRSSFKSADDDDSSFLSRLDQDTPPSFEEPVKFNRALSSTASLVDRRLAKMRNTRHQIQHTLNMLYAECQFEPQLLPTLEQSHQFHEVAPSTIAAVLREGVEADVSLLIVDCRFTYQFKGGHIKGAINITDPAQLETVLFHCPKAAMQRMHSRTAIVLHCEFSSKRGPAMYSLMRDLDRKLVGLEGYPMLLVPEMYVMAGGYSKFYQQYPVSFIDLFPQQLCEGSYTTMEEGTPLCKEDTLTFFKAQKQQYISEMKNMAF